MDTVRVLRIIEYVGPRKVVEEHLLKVAPSEQRHGELTIRSATIGSYPEILDAFADGKTEVEQPPTTETLCSICGHPQFNTQSGPSCRNGHGGAPPLEDMSDEDKANQAWLSKIQS